MRLGPGALAVLLLVIVGPAVPAAGADPETRTLTVSPSHDIVHGDELVVRGTGLQPNESVAIAQCRPGAEALFADCNWYSIPYVGIRGRFTTRMTADVVIDLYEESVDCRLVTCRIVLWRLRTGNLPIVAAPLHFDPAGPDPQRATGSVAPDTDLVDGQVVHVTADDVVDTYGGGRVGINQCRTPLRNVDLDCRLQSEAISVTDGHVSADVAVHTRLLFADGNADCRVDDCVLVLPSEAARSEQAAVPLAFDPMAPAPGPPTVDLAPDSDLVDGQTVHLTGHDLLRNSEVAVQQCPAGWSDHDVCREVTSLPRPHADRNGEMEAALRLRAVIRPFRGAATDCRVEACVLSVETFGVDGPVDLPTSFDPGAALLPSRLDVEPSTGLDPIQGVTVTGHDFVPDVREMQLWECVGRPVGGTDSLRHCDVRRHRVFRTSGDFVTRLGVRRHIATAFDGTVDCRVRHCRIWAYESAGGRAVASERLGFRRG